MGRQVTGAQNPVVLYVSGGNTQVLFTATCLSVCLYVIGGNTQVFVHRCMPVCLSVGWVIWPVKNVPAVTYNVSSWMLSLCSLTDCMLSVSAVASHTGGSVF